MPGCRRAPPLRARGPARAQRRQGWPQSGGPDEPRAAARQRKLSRGGGRRSAGPVSDVLLFVLAPSEGGHGFKGCNILSTRNFEGQTLRKSKDSVLQSSLPKFL